MTGLRVAVVGAGMAGLACAEILRERAIEVALFDKGRKPGGRVASVAIEDMGWDIGAQCFIAHDPSFIDQVNRWREAGWIAPWPDGPPGALVGTPSMAALVADRAIALDVRFGALVQSIEQDAAGWHVVGSDFRAGPFSALVIAVPAEQAAALLSLHDLSLAREAAAVRSMPCWTVMAAFAEPIDGSTNIYDGHGAIARAIGSRSKPGRGGAECWVLQASGEWSRAHLERTREEVAADLLERFAEECGVELPSVLFAKAHRWRFALPSGQPITLGWNDKLRLGACGDWCLGPTVEGAWLSGHALGRQIAGSMRQTALSAGHR